MSMDLDAITIADAARLIAARELSPVELVQAKLARIEALDPQINAFINCTTEHALRQARAAEAELAAGAPRGPLHGIPFALKDIYATSGIPTTGHSKVCKDNVPREDAAEWDRAHPLYRPMAVRIGAVLAFALALELGWALSRTAGLSVGVADGAPAVSSVAELGRVLFTDYMFAFEVTSILIIASMVGAVVLARKRED